MEVVRYLGENSSPVDGIHRREMLGLLDLFIGKQGLDDILAVVKSAVNRQTVHVCVEYGGHLGFLDGAHPSFREHDEHRDIFFVTETIDGG